MDIEVGVFRGQRGDARSEEGNAESVGGADPDGARQRCVTTGELRLAGDELALDAFQRCKEFAASIGEIATGGAPDEELCAEVRLERSHSSAKRSLVQPERTGGGEKLATAGDGEEETGIIPVQLR